MNIRASIKLFFILAFLLFAAHGWAYTEEHYVCEASEDAVGAHDGSNWANCFDGFADITWDTDDADDGNVGPNDVLYLRDDDGAYAEKLTVGASGTSGKPITITAGDGEFPVIDGRITISSWTGPNGNGEYTAQITNLAGTNFAYLLLQDGLPVNKGGTAGSLATGWWNYNAGDSTIYFKPVDSETSTSSWAAAGDVLVTIDQRSYITLEGLTIRGGIYGIAYLRSGATHGTNLIIDRCTMLEFGGRAIQMEAGQDDQIINNDLSYANEGLIKAGGGSDGSPTSGETDCDDIIIRNNKLHHSQYAKGFGESHVIDVFSYSTGALIEGNEFYENGYLNGGVYANGAGLTVTAHLSLDGVDDYIVRYNIFRDNYAKAINVGPDNSRQDASGGAIINNLFYNNSRATGTGFSPIVIYVRNGNADTQVDMGDFLIANNVFYNNQNNGGTAGVGMIHLSTTSSGTTELSGITIKNNIGFNNEQAYELSYNASDITLTLDNNLWFRSAGGDYLYYQLLSKAYPDTNSFATWQSDVGAPNSITSDPLFVNAAGGNFKLKPKSDAIDAGVLVSTMVAGWESYYGDNRLCGDGPDIGADEYCKSASLIIPPRFSGGSKTADWYTP